MPYGQSEHVDHGLMQTGGPVLAKAARQRFWMNSSNEKGLIGVDVAHTPQESLVQQQRFDTGVSRSQELQKIME